MLGVHKNIKATRKKTRAPYIKVLFLEASMRDINKTIEDIEASALKAEAAFQLWWGINHDGKNDHLDAMNNFKHVDFFHAVVPLLLQGILINLSRVFDRASDLSGIKSLKDDLATIGKHEAVTDIDKVLKNHVSTVKSIKGIRDQSVAHSKHAKSVDQIYQENPITPDQMKELISTIKEVVEIASKSVGRNSNILLSQRYLDATLSLLGNLRAKT